MSNGDTDTRPQLPLSFYGLNFLGRPVSVDVTGATGLGTPSAGVASSPSGGLGASAPGGDTGVMGASQVSRTGQTLGRFSQGLQTGLALQDLVRRGFGTASSGLESDTQAGEAKTAPEEAPKEETSIFDRLGSKIGDVGLPFTDETLGSLGSKLTTGLGDIGKNIESILPQSVVDIGEGIGSGIGDVLDLATGPIGDIAALATLPDLIGSFFGPPPAMAFPGDVTKQLFDAVNKGLPPALPIPANATPEQQAAIQAANDQITALAPQNSIAPHVQGNQSAQSNQNTLNNIKNALTAGFGKLTTLFPAAFNAFTAAQPSSLSEQVKQLGQAFSGNQFDQARRLLEQYFPTQAQAAAEQQITADLSAGLADPALKPMPLDSYTQQFFKQTGFPDLITAATLDPTDFGTVADARQAEAGFGAPLVRLQQESQAFDFHDVAGQVTGGGGVGSPTPVPLPAPDLANEFTEFNFPQNAANVLGTTEAALESPIDLLTSLVPANGAGQTEVLPLGLFDTAPPDTMASDLTPAVLSAFLREGLLPSSFFRGEQRRNV